MPIEAAIHAISLGFKLAKLGVKAYQSIKQQREENEAERQRRLHEQYQAAGTASTVSNYAIGGGIYNGKCLNL